MEQDQVNIRGIVQLPRAELAERQHHPAASRPAGARFGIRLAEAAAPVGLAEQEGYGASDRGLGGVAEPGHLRLDIRHIGHVGKRHAQRAAAAKPAQRRHHSGLVGQLVRGLLAGGNGGFHLGAAAALRDGGDQVRMRPR